MALALLWKNDRDGNPYYRSSTVLEGVLAGLRFWAGIQHGDGSFDEFYENEHSYCATAFTTYGASESLLALRDDIDQGDFQFVVNAVQCGADWLRAHDNPLAANQRMAALNALHNTFLLTGRACYQREAERVKDQIIASQSHEGWFPEYGGADIGYSSKGLDLLANYHKKTGDRETHQALCRLLDFFACFVHPDGSAGGGYGSRNGQHFFPYGLEVLAARGMEPARWILHRLHRGIKNQKALTPMQVDDRYLAYFYINSYAQAYLETTDEEPGPEGWHCSQRLFEDAGLLVMQTARYYAVVGLEKGGVIKVFQEEDLVYQDMGYFVRLGNGEKVASQGREQGVDWKKEESDLGINIEISTSFVLFEDSLPLAKYAIPFKLFSKTVLRSGKMAQWFHRNLKARKIARAEKRPVELQRKILFEEEKIRIEDSITRQGSCDVEDIGLEWDSTIIHSPSTRFFMNGELNGGSDEWREKALNLFEQGRKQIRIKRVLPFAEGKKVCVESVVL